MASPRSRQCCVSKARPQQPSLEPAAVALAYCLDENPVLKQLRL